MAYTELSDGVRSAASANALKLVCVRLPVCVHSSFQTDWLVGGHSH